MSRPPSDQTLRRLVADLAVSAPEDVTAILGELDAKRRGRVVALLEEFHGAPARPAKEAPLPPRPIAGLSPWLQARLDGDLATQPGFALSDGFLWDDARSVSLDGSFVMTPAARAALKDCAAGLAREDPKTPPAGPGSGWISRFGRFLLGGAPT